MRVLFLTRYAANGASSRLRFLQLMPGLEARGHECRASSFFGERWLERLYRATDPSRERFPYRARPGPGQLAELGRCWTRRLAQAWRSRWADVTVVEKELLPGLPWLVEAPLLRRAGRLVSDHDDAVGVQIDDSPLLRGKIERVMGASDVVVVANHELAERARRINPAVELIPTTLDVARYPVREHRELGPDRPLAVGWIGTPKTAGFLRLVAPALARLHARRPLELVAIGAGSQLELPGVPLRVRPWRLETEGVELARLDVGIMPLPDDAFSRAKSAYKLIQYMAAGLPVIASPVGENARVVRPGDNGFLAASDAAWEAALAELGASAKLRAELGRRGRKQAESEHALERAVAAWSALLDRVGA